MRGREGEEGGRGHHRTDDAKDEYDHGEVDLFEESQEYVHVCLYEGAAGHRDGGYGVLGVGLVLLAVSEDEGRLDDEDHAGQDEDDVEDVEQDDLLFEDEEREDGGEGGGAGGQHAHVALGHVLQAVEVDEDATRAQARPGHQL